MIRFKHDACRLVSPGKVPRQVLLGREFNVSRLETDYSLILDNFEKNLGRRRERIRAKG